MSSNKNVWDGNADIVRVHVKKGLCPNGSYVVGMRGIDTDRGGYCVSCISHIEFECRKL
ncbi:MAG: hypothetical protein SWX82_01800 [Cyanobacteriota bacterium]|nr:hypothetical protein [Cyanobacteriota bacterium]